MSMQVDGQSCVPPGFRFHPTEEELLNYYLRKKVAAEDIDLDVIRDVDLNKLEPWDIQEKCRIGSTPQNDWYLFSHKDKKYPTGTRTNRATAAGFWKATGRDKVIYSSCRRIGMRKTLVFYKGRAPHGQKSDWIMHEYRLDDHSVDLIPQSDVISSTAEAANQEDGWVVCRVFKKKSFHCKAMDNTNMMHHTKTQLLHSSSDDGLDQILQYIGRSCKQEGRAIADANCNTSAAHNIVQERFLRLPSLECPTYSQLAPCGYHTSYVPEPIHAVASDDQSDLAAGGADWAAFDRLLASQLDGQSTEQTALQAQFFDDHVFTFCSSDNEYKHGSDNGDLWSFTRSARSASMDRMGQVSI